MTGAGALTAAERRVAERAAAGQTNRAIAEALFVTTKTVELHLRNAYRKLGVSSRGELAGALGTVT
jgi:DNA-binding CsgD family transcriptional regulator